MRITGKLWRDEGGFVVTSELTLVASVAVIGLLVGLVAARDQVVNELNDFSLAISSLNQSYSFCGLANCHSSQAGSAFFDLQDECDGSLNYYNQRPNGVYLSEYGVDRQSESSQQPRQRERPVVRDIPQTGAATAPTSAQPSSFDTEI